MRITITLDDTETWTFMKIKERPFLSDATSSSVAKWLFLAGLKREVQWPDTKIVGDEIMTRGEDERLEVSRKKAVVAIGALKPRVASKPKKKGRKVKVKK